MAPTNAGVFHAAHQTRCPDTHVDTTVTPSKSVPDGTRVTERCSPLEFRTVRLQTCVLPPPPPGSQAVGPVASVLVYRQCALFNFIEASSEITPLSQHCLSP
ncbi:hypothetical protein AAFF_G00168050 [Aldrovandia affinis]|uniref:Uncharacterized protein n=1 Tax=Aldrovandia affinis TaxID=143900 RepID=A0AAD7RM31_9TELE|nr:hypothetical protein AAFF_G00168050 [Aldrovandia affinis]